MIGFGGDMRAGDVVIVGGGVVGSAVAHYLSTTHLIAPGQIVVIERDPSYSQCSTGRSAGGVRQQFSTPENIALSQVTLGLIKTLTSEFGAGADVGFKEQGYLILASNEGRSVLADNVALQRASGAETELIDGADLGQRFPWLNCDGVAAGSFGRSGEGWIDPISLMQLFRRSAMMRGVRYVTDAVVGFRRSSQIDGVMLASGAEMACGAVVNAAGAWAGALARMAGIDLPVEPRKRYVYGIDSRRATEAMRKGPLTVDPSGVWFRPEGRQFICGVSPEAADEPPAEDLDHIDYGPFENVVWPALAARIPAFEEAKVLNAWAGFYDYNTFDQNGIIGAHPDAGNFYFANGFSGHGLQQAAGAGRAIAELLLHGRFQTIDLQRFGYERVAQKRPLFELNVI
jgi:FAD-dependent oxidoreductase domain-containing protein 1